MSAAVFKMPERDDPIAALDRQIADTEKYLQSLKEAREILARSAGLAPKAGPYANLTPLDAATQILLSENRALSADELTARIHAGGQQYGKKDWLGKRNIKAGIGQSVGVGSLKEKNGLIGLPNWPSSKF
jgi:hypothetical protein